MSMLLRQVKHISAVLPQLLAVKDCGDAIRHVLGFIPQQEALDRAVFDRDLGKVLICLRQIAEAASNVHSGSWAAYGLGWAPDS